ncbi:MAG: hypothetical protein AABX13_03965 [Nanoarchaeota archaeon]
MDRRDQLKNIEIKIKEAADEIRRYSCAQKELWRRVPFLALEIERRNGGSRYGEASEDGYWRLGGSYTSDGRGEVCVDLATGELIDHYAIKKFLYYSVVGGDVEERKPSRRILAKDKDVLRVDLEELSAHDFVKRLTREAQEERHQQYPSYFTSAEKEEREKWYRKMKEKLERMENGTLKRKGR